MTILYRDEIFLDHETGQHPECPARLRSVHRRLDEQGLTNRFTRGQIREATAEELARVHTPQHIENVADFAQRGGGQIESDTVMSPQSFNVATHAAGTAMDAVDQVLSGADNQAVCLIRPPGHHAVPKSVMGFCLFNNVAVAAEHARQAYGVERVLIVDWDVHHGNGTQDAFYADEHITFFSAHRSPFYPGTGAKSETGTAAGLGTTFNLPLPYGISRTEYLDAFQNLLTDAAARSQPQLVLLSAGFDAHRADPVGSLGLESEDFAPLTRLLQDVANQYCEGKLVSLLEGGYNLNALAESIAVHLETLLEKDASK